MKLNQNIHRIIHHNHQPNNDQQWIIKRLIQPRHKISKKSINIYTAQVCYFINGDIQAMYANKDVLDLNIKKINKINPQTMYKILSERRKLFRQTIKKINQNFTLQNIIHPQQNNKIINKHNINKFRVNSAHRQEQKLNKRKSIGSTNGDEVNKNIKKNSMQQMKTKNNMQQMKTQSREAIKVRYNDGYEHLMTQKQFMNLSLRRRKDPIWLRIHSIRNYTHLQEQQDKQIVIEYKQNSIKYKKLKQRAQRWVLVQGQNIIQEDKKYISQQQEMRLEQQLEQKDIRILYEYIVYKIIKYIQYFYDEKIIQCTFILLKNILNQIQIINITHLIHKSTIKYTWTNQTYLNKINQLQENIIYNKNINQNLNILPNSILIGNQMLHQYDNLKQHYGLSPQIQQDQQQIINNLFFKKMYPHVQGNLSQLLKNQSLTLKQFRSKYMGYHKPKIPIIKQFTSHLIRNIHKSTQPLKRANHQPHDQKNKLNSISIMKTRKLVSSNKYHSTATTLATRTFHQSFVL